MKTLRLILTLLLCLTVPVAGWASVMGGSAPCPTSHHEHASEHQHSNQHSHHHAAGAVASERSHHDAGAICLLGKACKGERCGCGCGMGTCSSPQFNLLAMRLPELLSPSHQYFRARDQAAVLVARGSTPLRPPIS